MIDFNYLDKFELSNEGEIRAWLEFVLDEEDRELGEVSYIFCDDEYLYDLNVKHLKHNTLTDIISFDYSLGKVVSGDIYISVERVEENAKDRGIKFSDELDRIMVHGLLHYIGFKDKSEWEKKTMRNKEDYYLS
ncbi:MAG: rRNA maturation RNase YbeY, partial [Lutimonas sp.]